MPAPRTQKDDWMNDLLANSGFLVSGHATFSTQLGLGADILPAIRHARLYTSNYPDIIMLTLECPTDPIGLINSGFVQNSGTYKELARLFGQLPILAFQQQLANYFVLDAGSGPEELNDEKLQSWFASIDPSYLNNVGTAKSVNRSVNDMFVPWTGANLASACVFNDIDAVLPPRGTNRGVLMELKRPSTDLASWGPYLNDSRNYESCAAIAQCHKLENRTVAHNITRTPQVHLFLDVHRETQNGRQVLASNAGMVAPDEVAKTPLSDAIVQQLRPHSSTKGQVR